MSCARCLLTRLDRNLQAIGWRRKRAFVRGVIGAVGVVGPVEIDHVIAGCCRLDVEVAASGIRIRTRRHVCKRYEEVRYPLRTVLHKGAETALFSSQCELEHPNELHLAESARGGRHFEDGTVV